LIAVFIPPIDRLSDYNLNDDFVAFLATELLPFVQRTYKAGLTANKTLIIGQGTGGATAVYTALARPSVFGLVVSQSGVFSLKNEAILRQLSLSEAAPIQFYLTVGTYETALDGDRQAGNVIGINREMAALLNQKGYRYTLDERPEGHSWGLWWSRLAPALESILTP
jgi:enterochelin esterase-like enzyme